MKLIFSLKLLYVVLSCLLILSNAHGQDKNDRLVLTGSSTVAPLLAEIAKRYEKNHPGVRIDVQTGGTTRGINDAKSGVADIGMASREPKSGEKNLNFYTVAMDGVAIILNSKNPVKNLTRDQVRDIFTGKIKSWSELPGGLNEEIIIVNKAEGRSTLELFLKYFKLKSKDIKAHVIIGDNQQGIKTVTVNPHSIGYVSIGSAYSQIKDGTVPLKLLPMSNVVASMDTVARGKYPLSRPLNMVTKTKPVGLAKDFIAYALSGDVDDIIKEQYFVPVNK